MCIKRCGRGPRETDAQLRRHPVPVALPPLPSSVPAHHFSLFTISSGGVCEESYTATDGAIPVVCAAADVMGCAAAMQGPTGATEAGSGLSASAGARRSGARSQRSPEALPFTPSSTLTQGRHRCRARWASSQHGHRLTTVSGVARLALTPLWLSSLLEKAAQCTAAGLLRQGQALHCALAGDAWDCGVGIPLCRDR